jgi:pantoate--beta-alanine ligase
MEVARSIAEMRAIVKDWRKADQRVSLVPTMGTLHTGHISLVHLGQEKTDKSVVSIFVNPTQFAPHEDFNTYPRDEERDFSALRKAGVNLVFAPPVEEIYPDNHHTKVEVEGISQLLEGQFRPQFFIGVATVVAKLLIQVMPDVALFGEKDYQQLCVIRAMARDLDLPVDVIGGDTIRESDGLAMSSRNAYLSNAERVLAPRLYQEISAIADRVSAGADIDEVCTAASKELAASGFKAIDYIVVKDADTLEDPTPGRPMRVLAAAWLGRTRLIDNIAVPA